MSIKQSVLVRTKCCLGDLSSFNRVPIENGLLLCKKTLVSVYYKCGNNERKKQRGSRDAGEKKSTHLLCARIAIQKERNVWFLGKERKDTSFYGWERRTREVE